MDEGIGVYKDLFLVFLDEVRGFSIEEMEEILKKAIVLDRVVRYITSEEAEEIYDIGYTVEIFRVQETNP